MFERLNYEDREFAKQVIMRAFSTLTEIQKLVMLLSADGFTQEEIATMLKVSQSAVSQQFTVARGQLSVTAEELRN
jgi:RNA polymerase sigma factor (sigma-70 family)